MNLLASLIAAGVPARDITVPHAHLPIMVVRRIHDYDRTVTIEAEPDDDLNTWWTATDNADEATFLACAQDFDVVATAVRDWWSK